MLLFIFSGIVLVLQDLREQLHLYAVGDGSTYILIVCLVVVLALLLFAAFHDRSDVYHVTESVGEEDAGVVLELRVEGTMDSPPYAKFFPVWLGLDPPPPRHRWSTQLPTEAYGIIDSSEYRQFVMQLNEIGGTVDDVNAEATFRRVLLLYVASPLLVISGGILVTTPLGFKVGLELKAALGLAISMGTTFCIGLLCAQYVALEAKYGKEESAIAADDIACQDLSALARSPLHLHYVLTSRIPHC